MNIQVSWVKQNLKLSDLERKGMGIEKEERGAREGDETRERKRDGDDIESRRFSLYRFFLSPSTQPPKPHQETCAKKMTNINIRRRGSHQIPTQPADPLTNRNKNQKPGISAGEGVDRWTNRRKSLSMENYQVELIYRIVYARKEWWVEICVGRAR